MLSSTTANTSRSRKAPTSTAEDQRQQVARERRQAVWRPVVGRDHDDGAEQEQRGHQRGAAAALALAAALLLGLEVADGAEHRHRQRALDVVRSEEHTSEL